VTAREAGKCSYDWKESVGAKSHEGSVFRSHRSAVPIGTLELASPIAEQIQSRLAKAAQSSSLGVLVREQATSVVLTKLSPRSFANPD